MESDINTTIIHFSHGNSFPASCYQEFFSCLGSDYKISYIDTLGHNPNYPVSDNWDFLVDELINAIETNESKPLFGVGHSFGGVLTFLAASRRPDLFKAVILLETPLFGRLKSMLIKLIKQIGLIDSVTPARRTKNRKRHWKSAAEAFDYLRKKEVFKHFTQTSLENYIKYGMEPTEEGLQLKFNVDIESQIYQTVPHHLARYKKQFRTPLALIYGNRSDMIRRYDLRSMQRNFKGIVIRQVEGGHLFPFENPVAAAESVQEIIKLFK